MHRVQIILVASLLFLAAPVITADTLTGRVLRVIEGDQLVVLTPGQAQQRVRLEGIDAPERGQTGGGRSRDYLARQVTGRFVVVDYQRRDRYGALVGKVLLGGVDMNLEQLKAGMAWYYRHFAEALAPSDRMAYEQAEQEARRERRGLWANDSAAPPWDWRQAPPWMRQRQVHW